MKLNCYVLQVLVWLINYTHNRHIKTIEIISVEDSSSPKLYNQNLYYSNRGKKQRELKSKNATSDYDDNCDILGNNWVQNNSLDDDKIKQIMLNFNLSKVSFVNTSSIYELDSAHSSCIYDDINKMIDSYWKKNNATNGVEENYVTDPHQKLFLDFIRKWNQTFLNSSKLHFNVHQLLYQPDLFLDNHNKNTINEICQAYIISYFNNKLNKTSVSHELLEDCKSVSTAYYESINSSTKGNLINYIQNSLKVKSSHTHQVYKYSEGKMQKQVIKDKYNQYTIINTKIEEIQHFINYLSNQYIFPKLLIYPYSSILIEVECNLDCYVTVEYNHLLIIKDKLLEFTHYIKSHPSLVNKKDCTLISMKTFITLCYIVLVFICLAVTSATIYMIYYLIQSPKLMLDDLDISMRKNASNASKFLNESIV